MARRTRRHGIAATLALLVAGSPAVGQAATTSPTPPTVTPRLPGDVAVAATCPVTTSRVPPENVNELISRQAALQTTAQQTQRYATVHPDVFGAVGFGGANNGFVVVSFTDDLGVHARALRELVDVPAGVIVCPARVSGAAAWALVAEIIKRVTGRYSGASISQSGRARINLNADQRPLADELIASYGDQVEVQLGAFPYPNINQPPAPDGSPVPICGTVPKPGPSNAAVRWSANPSRLSVNTGGNFEAKVTFTNRGRRPIRFESGDPIIGLVTATGGRQVLTTYVGPIAGIGYGGTLRNGQRATVGALVSTASCDRRLGWALPPGTYRVRFVFGGYDYSANGGAKAEQFVSSPFALTITPAPERPTA